MNELSQTEQKDISNAAADGSNKIFKGSAAFVDAGITLVLLQ